MSAFDFAFMDKIGAKAQAKSLREEKLAGLLGDESYY
jgi:hypothetical protein